MTHDELEEAVPLYAAGALERAERQALEAHLLSGCVPCHTALKEFQSTAALLPFGLQHTPPPRSLKATIMTARASAKTVEEPQEKQPTRPSLEPGEWMNHLFPPENPASIWSVRWGFGLAALGVMTVGLYLAWDSYQTLSQETVRLQALSQEHAAQMASLEEQVRGRQQFLDEVRAELEHHQQEALALAEQLSAKETELEDLRFQILTHGQAATASRMPEVELASVLRQQSSPPIPLSGSEKARQASGLVLYDSRTHKVWLYTAKLPRCPQGMHYHLWALGDTPVSMGTFHNHGDETTHQFVTTTVRLAPDQAFAVSLEPMGDRTTPSGQIYLTNARVPQ